MIPLDLSGKVALVTGVGDNVGFAWYIAKALNAAGARLIFATQARLVGIVEKEKIEDLRLVVLTTDGGAFQWTASPANSAALARIRAPWLRSAASRATSGSTLASPAPAL